MLITFMKQILKKFTDKVSSFSKNKKQLWLAVLLFSVVGIVLPVFPVYAVSWLTDIAVDIVLQLAIVICQMAVIIPAIILGMVVGILEIATSPTLFNASFTNNAFVVYGWTITKNLANIGFIILLAFIGLGTALRIQEYQWQKTLPRLFFILLIINFTPVICGFIIDAANIVMNYFLDGASGWAAVSNELSAAADIVVKTDIAGVTIIDDLLGTAALILFKIIALVAVMGATIFIYLLFTALFLTRYVMLWVLIILSPIAFFTYVFKESSLVKTLFPGILHWEEWWSNFLQWSIIGVTLSFFLFLSNSLKGILGSGAMTVSALPPSASGGGFLDGLMPYIVNVALLIVGFLTAIKTAPMGAGAVTSKVKGVGRSVNKIIVKPAVGAVAGFAAGTAVMGGRIAKKPVGYAGEKISAQMDKSSTGRWAKKGMKKVEKEARYWTPGVKSLGEKARGDEEARSKHEKDFKKRAQAGHMDEVRRISKDTISRTKDEREGAKRVIADYRPDKIGKDMEKTIKEKSAKAYAKTVMPEALEDINVLAAMDQQKYDAIGGNEGNPAQREAIMKTIMEEDEKTKENLWDKKIKKIKKTDPEKANRMQDIFIKLQADPNYFGVKTKKKKQKAKKRKEPPKAWYG